MSRNVLTVLVGRRSKSAINVQKILTTWGCLIKTRLGIHDGVLNKCSDHGLIILELVGEQKKQEKLTLLLDTLPGVSAKLVELSLEK